MIARIVNDRWIYLDNVTEWEESMIDDHFSAEVPNSRYIESSELQSWDGVYRRYNFQQQRLARPFLGELRAFCKKKDLQIVVEDKRPPAKYKPISIDKLTESFLPGITLKDFQIKGIKRVWSTEVGIFDIPTGGGKTELMAAVCKIIRCPTAIIAEQRIVIDQIRERLMLRDVCEEPGLFYAGKMPTGQLIIVGTIQSLVAPTKRPQKPEKKNYKTTKHSTQEKKYEAAKKRYEISLKAFRSRNKKAKAIRKRVGKCHMILVDECDLATGDTYKKLFRYWFKGRRRYGFTGTPYDEQKPVQQLFLREHLGSVIYKQTKTQVQKAGLIVPLEYFTIVIDGGGKKNDDRAFDIALDEDMIYSDQFHRIVRALCAKHRDEGTLILVERHDLGHALNAIIPDCDFVYGNTPKKKRPEILSAFENRKIKVLIGGKNVRRGLDLSGGCENLVLATGGKLESEFDQRLGRARRLNPNGKARVYDFYWMGNKHLHKHSVRRLKSAIKLGCETHVVYPDGIIDGEAFVRSQFKRPNFARRK